MYEELLYVVSHQLGKRKVESDEISPGDLIVYGQKVFYLFWLYSTNTIVRKNLANKLYSSSLKNYFGWNIWKSWQLMIVNKLWIA